MNSGKQLRQCMSQGKSYQECTMDENVVKCWEKTENADFAKVAQESQLLKQ